MYGTTHCFVYYNPLVFFKCPSFPVHYNIKLYCLFCGLHIVLDVNDNVSKNLHNCLAWFDGMLKV